MKLSVVVPIYNVSRRLLEPSLSSILKQTLRADEYEIVLVDDASTEDNTINAIKETAARTTNVNIVRHSKNRGLNHTRQTGVAAATGDYVVFVDADDILTRDALENLRMEAHRAKADLVTAPFFRWDIDNKGYYNVGNTAHALPTNYLARLKQVLSGNHSFTMCGRLFRRELLSNDVFDLPQKTLHEDITTFVRILFKSQVSTHVSKPIYNYSFNARSITHEFTCKHFEGVFWAFQDWIRNAELHSNLRELSDDMPAGIEKLVHMCVDRCVRSESLSVQNKIKILDAISDRYHALPLNRRQPSLAGSRFLEQYEAEGVNREQLLSGAELVQQFPRRISRGIKSYKTMVPTTMAKRLKGRIVFICQIDYQLRHAAAFANELAEQGHLCSVLDNSAFAADGRRQLSDPDSDAFDLIEYIKIKEPPYKPDWLSTAKLLINFNDHNDDFREALEYRNRLDLPSVCVVEGISDFLRADFKRYRFLPYRRCDYVFLAGEHDKTFFQDRTTYVTGLPSIEILAEKKPSFPSTPLAVLNVNFTYGVLESERDPFIASANRAFAATELDWVITKHPMDKSDLSAFPVSPLTQYELIDNCSVFVSRFATGILESLASGKPAIYFNPHNEKVDKFKTPLGAFDVATSEEELAEALRRVLADIEAGVDFRERSLPFLEHHTGYNVGSPSSATRFANAVTDILPNHVQNESAVTKLFAKRMNEQQLLHDEGAGRSRKKQVPDGWNYQRYLLYNREARLADAFSEREALAFYREHGGAYRFAQNETLLNKNHVVTLLGYSKVDPKGSRHTNWFPWNRFHDVFRTIGYTCEWTEFSNLQRSGESRIFIVWNEPTALQLFESGSLQKGDIVLQKLTSLGKGMEKVNWTEDPRAWAKRWDWPIYRTAEYLVDIGVELYAFGCATDIEISPEKKRIVTRLEDRIFWIPWGGTPFSWPKVLAAKPIMDGFLYDAAFVGSKWGRVGRGNIDAWEKYLSPFETSDEFSFSRFGGIGQKMVSDDEMVTLLQASKLCPIIHAPSWQAERGLQDRFYSVFLSGRFGICDNLGAVDLFGTFISDICTEDPTEYHEKSIHFLRNTKEQLPYVEHIQSLIKRDLNFYVSWYNILSSLPDQSTNL